MAMAVWVGCYLLMYCKTAAMVSKDWYLSSGFCPKIGVSRGVVYKVKIQ